MKDLPFLGLINDSDSNVEDIRIKWDLMINSDVNSVRKVLEGGYNYLLYAMFYHSFRITKTTTTNKYD